MLYVISQTHMDEAIKIDFVKEAIPNHIQHKISIFIISYNFTVLYIIMLVGHYL